MNLTPISEMDREEAIKRLCVMVVAIAGRAFVEEFQQPHRASGKAATLIGIEVLNKDAGVRMLGDLASIASHIQMLPVNP